MLKDFVSSDYMESDSNIFGRWKSESSSANNSNLDFGQSPSPTSIELGLEFY